MISNPSSVLHTNVDTILSNYQCALIDSQGKEIPITNQMIQQACEDLEAKHNNYYAQIPKPSANR